MEEYQENDPRHHTEKIKRMLDDVINHAQEDMGKTDNVKARALFDTTSKLLGSLKGIYEEFENQLSNPG